MKKFFSILTVFLVILNFIACENKKNDEPENPSAPEEQKAAAAITINLSNITGSSVKMQVEPDDADATYYFTLALASNLEGMSDEEMIEQVLIAEMDYILDYYSKYNPTYADLLSTGNDGYEFTGLDAKTEYIALAAYIDYDGKAIDGKLAKEVFSTTAASSGGSGGSGGGTGNLTFNVQKSSSGITVTPSNNTDTWDYYFMLKSEFASNFNSNPDALAEAAYDYYGNDYAVSGSEEFLYSEMLEYGLTAGSYVFVVWGCNASKVTTKAVMTEFTLTSSSSYYYAPSRMRMPLRKTVFGNPGEKIGMHRMTVIR